MKAALDMAFVGICLLILAYMVMMVLGFSNGRCLIGLGVIAIVTWTMGRSNDDV